MKPSLTLNSWRENSFYACLLLFVAFLPFSEAMVSIVAGILLFQALVLTSWNHPSVPHGSVKSLLIVLSVFMVYLLGMLFTRDLPFALYELKKVIFWIVIPVAFYISPRLSDKRFLCVLAIFILAVFVGSLVATFRLIFSDQQGISGFREIIPVSHIRFSFQLILALIVTGWFLWSKTNLPVVGYRPILLLALMVWFLFFLLLLKSITGIIALLGTAYLLLGMTAVGLKRWLHKGIILVLLMALVAVPLAYVAKVWHDFFAIEMPDPGTVDQLTLSGNPYTFDFSSREKENGHWVNLYICEQELRQEWNKISSVKFDKPDGGGYTCSSTLIRYLTGKGLRKDSAGISKLTPADIKAIEQGIANPVYVGRSFSLYPRIYETIWELDRYSRSGNPNDQSFSQRIEYVKASLRLIGKNPWFGIGTGNWKIKYAEVYREMNSQLRVENMGPSHNQYLNYLVKFGVTGFLLIMAALLVPVFLEGHHHNLVFWLFLISIGFANFGDANLETHMGLSFFCFFYGLFLWHSPPGFREPSARSTLFHTR